MSEIILKNVNKIYNKDQTNQVYALRNISFSINQGEFVVILGASGAGKTTLLNILGGMDKATSGLYQVGDTVVSDLKDSKLTLFRRTQVGFVFQFYNLMPNLTALENVKLAESVSKKTLGSKTALKAVELSKRHNNFPSQLSGGEQQRVSIARAIVKKPELLLCDEPTGALDSKTGVQIIKLLRKINKEQKTTVIIVTHNSLLAQLADRVIKIQDGRIVQNAKIINPRQPEEIKW